MAMEAIPELEVASRVGQSQSSIVDFDIEQDQVESLTSSIMEQAKQKKSSNHLEVTRKSRDEAASLLKNTSKGDSTFILATRLDSLRELETQNQMLTE